MSGDGSGYMCLPLHALHGSGVPHCSVGQVHDSYTVSVQRAHKVQERAPTARAEALSVASGHHMA